MFISLDDLVSKYKLNIKAIIHIGAHECEEIGVYEKYIGKDKTLWVEAMPDKVQYCKAKFPGILIENECVSDKKERVKFNISNNGHSSSFLEFDLHKDFYPDISYTYSYDIETEILSKILDKYSNIDFNFMNLNIQGTELKALIGLGEKIKNFDYIYTKVNESSLYKGCGLIGEIDAYLKKYNFERVETVMTNEKWGDAFYMRKNRKKVVFKKGGDLGESLYRYIICAFLCVKYNLEYIYEDDFKWEDRFIFYKGVDHYNDDIFPFRNNIESSLTLAEFTHNVVCFNTFGYFKNRVDLNNLISNKYINNENGQGLFVKNIIDITSESLPVIVNLELSHANLIVSGFFHLFDFMGFRAKTFEFIQKNKENHYFITEKGQKIRLKDILDVIEKYNHDTVIMIDECNSGSLDNIKKIARNSKSVIFRNYDNHKTETDYDELTKFHIMKNSKKFIGSNDVLSWCVCAFSNNDIFHIPKYYFQEYTYFDKLGKEIIYYEIPQKKFNRIKAVILTLDSQNQRQKSKIKLANDLNTIGIEYEFFNGINGKNIQFIQKPEKSVLYLDSENVQFNYIPYETEKNNLKKPGQFGILWSNYKILKKFLDDNENDIYILFEDDASLVVSHELLYNYLRNIPANIDGCSIAKSDWFPFQKNERINNYYCKIKKEFFSRATAYIVTKSGANKILNYFGTDMIKPWDDLLSDIFRFTDFNFCVSDRYLFHEPEGTISIANNI